MKKVFELESLAFLQTYGRAAEATGHAFINPALIITVSASRCAAPWRSLLPPRFQWQGTICPQGENLENIAD